MIAARLAGPTRQQTDVGRNRREARRIRLVMRGSRRLSNQSNFRECWPLLLALASYCSSSALWLPYFWFGLNRISQLPRPIPARTSVQMRRRQQTANNPRPRSPIRPPRQPHLHNLRPPRKHLAWSAAAANSNTLRWRSPRLIATLPVGYLSMPGCVLTAFPRTRKGIAPESAGIHGD